MESFNFVYEVRSTLYLVPCTSCTLYLVMYHDTIAWYFGILRLFTEYVAI